MYNTARMADTQNYNRIQPVSENFRNLRIEEAFTWKSGIPIGAKGLYVVAFLSKRNLSADSSQISTLLELDFDAMKEAEQMPGFGTYWHDDELAENGTGLSFCLWETPEDGKNAASQPAHQKAVKFALGEGKSAYKDYRVIGNIAGRPIDAVEFQPIFDSANQIKT
jgi:hypothetical protein